MKSSNVINSSVLLAILFLSLVSINSKAQESVETKKLRAISSCTWAINIAAPKIVAEDLGIIDVSASRKQGFPEVVDNTGYSKIVDAQKKAENQILIEEFCRALTKAP